MNIFCKILKFFGLKKEKCQINKEPDNKLDELRQVVKEMNKKNSLVVDSTRQSDPMKALSDTRSSSHRIKPLSSILKTNNEDNKLVKDINNINLTPVPSLDKNKIDLSKFDEEVKKYKKNYQNNKKDIDKLNKDIVDNIPKLNITPVPTLEIDKIDIDGFSDGPYNELDDQEEKKVTTKKRVRKTTRKLTETPIVQPSNVEITEKPDLKKKDKKVTKPKSKKAPKSPSAKRVKKTDKKD